MSAITVRFFGGEDRFGGVTSVAVTLASGCSEAYAIAHDPDPQPISKTDLGLKFCGKHGAVRLPLNVRIQIWC